MYQLKLTCPDHPGQFFYASPSSMKIEKAGPPNQFFQNNASSTGSVGPLVENEDEGDDEDCEPVEDGALIENSDDGKLAPLIPLLMMTL